MPLDQLLPLVALAFAGSFTPGPNNTIATLTAANHGFRAVLPHLVGVPFGFATMLLAGATGIAAVLLARPMVAQAIKWAGVAYLLLIALQIARAGSPGERSSLRPLTFWQSVAFQYANPKGWMLAVATAGSFMTIRPTAATTAVIVAVWAVAALASLALWASVGSALRTYLAEGARPRRFNLAMGLLLGGTAAWLAAIRGGSFAAAARSHRRNPADRRQLCSAARRGARRRDLAGALVARGGALDPR